MIRTEAAIDFPRHLRNYVSHNEAGSCVKRLQLFEILDQHWCPRPVRDGATDFLEFITSTTDLYSAVRGPILEAIRGTGSQSVVDLCSGGGGPWLSRKWQAARLDQQWPLAVALTDKFPSEALQHRLDSQDSALSAVTYSVDAALVPESLRGFRTIFASFHHFPDAAAAQVLADAVRAGEGIATAEVTSRTFKALAVICFTPVLCLLCTPFIRPFRLPRILLTYLLPAIPLTVLWDGLVSCLRTRTPGELKALAAGLEGYSWTSGYVSGGWLPLSVVYLTGSPVSHGARTHLPNEEPTVNAASSHGGSREGSAQAL